MPPFEQPAETPQDKPATTPPNGAAETELFFKSSDKAQALFAEAKRVRRQVERKAWWDANKPTQ